MYGALFLLPDENMEAIRRIFFCLFNMLFDSGQGENRFSLRRMEK
jgi:hypothetical protein